MTTATNAKPPRRWMRWVLLVSLTLNLLVIGLATGAALRLSGWGEGPPNRALGPMLYRELPREDRRVLRGTLRTSEVAPPMRPRQQARAMALLLRADPFETEAMAALLAQQRQTQVTFQSEVQRTWLVHVTQMTLDERAAYADRLEAAVERHRRKRQDTHRSE